MTYQVTHEISEGWDTSAKVGEILTEEIFEGRPALYNSKGQAVCDVDSKTTTECCQPLYEKAN